MSFKNIPDMLNLVCKKYSYKSAAFVYRKDGIYHELTHLELLDKVESFAIALLELGIHKGDRVGLVAENSIEWIISCFAINMIGAVDVPLFPILSAKQEAEIFADCSVTAIILSTEFQLNKICEEKKSLAHLRQIITFANQFEHKELYIHSFDVMLEHGSQLRTKEERQKLLSAIIDTIDGNDLLTLIYTSGTTGKPKGVMLTHNNILSNISDAMDVLGDFEKDTSLMFLPMCHAYERTSGFYTLFQSGTRINLAESIESVPAQLMEVQPTMITTVPKLLENIKKKIYNNISKESKSKQRIFNWAVNVGIKKAYDLQDNKSNPINNMQYKIADKLVFAKLRDKLGGKLNKIISGGAPLTTEVEAFFKGIGIDVLQGYGLTEASPIVAANRINDFEFGSIGKPLTHVNVRLADDGEILVKGPNVMKGYYNDPISTNEAIDDDGWLHTGDIAIYTSRGNLKITDRKKNLFVSSGGKNIAPQPIESLISQSRYIDHCFLIGDNRDYISALISPNFEQVQKLADELDIKFDNSSELISHPRIIKFIRDEIDFYQKNVSKYERIRKFQLLSEPFSTSGGELTPKMSVRRNEVEKKYSQLIEGMYSGR